MPFNIEPKAGPSIIAPSGTKASDSASARERAIAMLTKVPEPTPVSNPSQVAPEEMTVVRPASQTAAQDAEKGQSNNSEAASKDEEVTKPKDEATLSSQYALLARKEKALRAKSVTQDAALKAREQALLAKEAELKAKEESYSNDFISKSRLTEDPISVLLDAGIDYDTITQLALNRPQMDPVMNSRFQKLDAQVKAQAEIIERAQKQASEAQANQYKQAVNQIRNETNSLVQDDPNFETIKTTGAVDDVVELIERTFKQDGILLTIEDACQQVEDYLIEEAVKLSRIEKIKKRLSPQEPPKAPEAQKQDAQSKPQTKTTLTNSMGSQQPLSVRERAILAFKGELRKS